MSTATTSSTMVLIRNRILGFSYGGVTVASLLGTRLYQDGVPDAPTYPFAVLRLLNESTTSEYGDGIRSTADIEVMVFDRPRTQLTRARTLADLIDGALNQWTFAGAEQGFLKVTGRRRDTLPQGSGDVDREVVQVWLTYSTVLWSQSLARHFT